MTDVAVKLPDFTLAYYEGDRKTGSVSIVECEDGQTRVRRLAVAPESGLEKSLKPVFVGLTEDQRVIVLDPKSKAVNILDAFPADAFPAHIYSDPNSERDWFMNDGDKETGNDTLNCGDQGSSVTVVEASNSAQARYLKTICVGRGHHQATFSFPSERAPEVPARAYISNLKDGTLSVIGNDPADAETWLQVVATINLCEPDKEDERKMAVPNNAFPHGLAYSPHTGKVYNLNNGYGTIAVIDPITHEIETRIAFKGHSNLFITPDGRYIIGRGADRKSDPHHVIAKLTVLDLDTGRIHDTVDLPDVYISKYYFNPEGDRLYLTTSSSGSPEQQAHLKEDALLVFDISGLPTLKQVGELRLGASSGSLSFHGDGGRTTLVFSSSSARGEVAVLHGGDHSLVMTIAVSDGLPHSRAWLL